MEELIGGFENENNELRAKLDRLQTELALLKADWALQDYVITGVEKALNGEEVNDFMGSFTLVRMAIDLKAERDRLKADLRKYGRHSPADGITPMCERDKHSDNPCTCGFENALCANPESFLLMNP